MAMDDAFRGASRWIVTMQGGRETYEEAVAQIPGDRDKCPAQLMRYLQRVADGHVIKNPEHFRHEGDGIYAVKAHCGLRAYGWFDQYQCTAAFVVSHYILKKWDGFRKADRDRVKKNRETYQQLPERSQR